MHIELRFISTVQVKFQVTVDTLRRNLIYNNVLCNKFLSNRKIIQFMVCLFLHQCNVSNLQCVRRFFMTIADSVKLYGYCWVISNDGLFPMLIAHGEEARRLGAVVRKEQDNVFRESAVWFVRVWFVLISLHALYQLQFIDRKVFHHLIGLKFHMRI